MSSSSWDYSLLRLGSTTDWTAVSHQHWEGWGFSHLALFRGSENATTHERSVLMRDRGYKGWLVYPLIFFVAFSFLLGNRRDSVRGMPSAKHQVALKNVSGEHVKLRGKGRYKVS